MKKFDRDKYLKQLKFKRAWRKYERYFYIGVPCLMIVMLGIYFAYSKFFVSEEQAVIRTTVGDFIYGDVVIGAYIDGEYSSTIPGKNDGYVVDKVSCDNGAVGKWNDDDWGLLTTNMTKRSKCNVYFETKKPSVVEAVTTAMSADSSMFASDDGDKNVRYIGANPNNYVYFNCSDYNNQSDSTCEKWRIIGVFNNVTKSDGTKENLVKIIRDESIGKYPWDSSDSTVNDGLGVSDWSDADVMKLLNPGYDSESVGGSLYYNAKSGTCYADSSNSTTSCDFASTGLKNDTTRNAIENVVWKLGGIDASETITTGMFYTAERGVNVYSGRPETWTGKIGLMYPSDYGYATAGGSSNSRTKCLEKNLIHWEDLSDCYKNDYFYKSYRLTMTPDTSFATGMYVITLLGRATYADAGNPGGVYPALYLKSSISVVDGNGTSTSPYQLEM